MGPGFGTHRGHHASVRAITREEDVHHARVVGLARCQQWCTVRLQSGRQATHTSEYGTGPWPVHSSQPQMCKWRPSTGSCNNKLPRLPLLNEHASTHRGPDVRVGSGIQQRLHHQGETVLGRDERCTDAVLWEEEMEREERKEREGEGGEGGGEGKEEREERREKRDKWGMGGWGHLFFFCNPRPPPSLSLSRQN